MRLSAPEPDRENGGQSNRGRYQWHKRIRNRWFLIATLYTSLHEPSKSAKFPPRFVLGNSEFPVISCYFSGARWKFFFFFLKIFNIFFRKLKDSISQIRHVVGKFWIKYFKEIVIKLLTKFDHCENYYYIRSTK